MKLGINCTELVTLTNDDRARIMNDIAAFGFGEIRVEIPMMVDWSAVANMRARAAVLGLVLLPVLGVHMAPGYTPASFADFARRAAAELDCPAYEIMNEPNLHSFNAWAQAAPIVPLIQRGGAAVKGVRPGAKIVFGGLAACVTSSWWQFWFRNASPEQFLADSLRLGVGEFFDELGYHPYSIDGGFTPQPPTSKQMMISRIPLLQKQAERPVRLTEWGFDWTKTSPTVGAQWFRAQLPLMGNGSYFYAWRDYGQYRNGLVDANNVPRQPIFDAVKAAIQ